MGLHPAPQEIPMKKNNETPPPLLTGKISAHRDGYGFFVPNDGSEDLFIHSDRKSVV